MKKYLKAILVASLMFGLAAACNDDKEDGQIYDEIQKINDDLDATDGSEVKRPGGGNG